MQNIVQMKIIYWLLLYYYFLSCIFTNCWRRQMAHFLQRDWKVETSYSLYLQMTIMRKISYFLQFQKGFGKFGKFSISSYPQFLFPALCNYFVIICYFRYLIFLKSKSKYVFLYKVMYTRNQRFPGFASSDFQLRKPP